MSITCHSGILSEVVLLLFLSFSRLARSLTACHGMGCTSCLTRRALNFTKTTFLKRRNKNLSLLIAGRVPAVVCQPDAGCACSRIFFLSGEEQEQSDEYFMADHLLPGERQHPLTLAVVLIRMRDQMLLLPVNPDCNTVFVFVSPCQLNNDHVIWPNRQANKQKTTHRIEIRLTGETRSVYVQTVLVAFVLIV